MTLRGSSTNPTEESDDMTSRMFLRKLAPDFMWCTSFDLFVMYEQINEAIEFHAFRQTLHQLFKRGEFACKSDDAHHRKGRLKRMLYIRKHPSNNSEETK